MFPRNFLNCLRYVFPKKLGLDSILESWDLKIRIPRQKLRIWSYSQAQTRPSRSKYLNCYVLCFRFLAFPWGPGGFDQVNSIEIKLFD